MKKIGKFSIGCLLRRMLILFTVMVLATPAMGELSRNGLIAEYHFDGNANDSSGNQNNGTIYGATFVQGISGQALNFDGVNDYVQIPSNSALDNRNFTFCVWFYQIGKGKDSANTVLDRLWNGSNQNTDEDVVTLYTWNQEELNLYYNWNGYPDHPSNEYFISSAMISNHVWYFVCVTKYGRNVRIYVNGQNSDNITLTDDVYPYVNSASWLIGAQIDTGTILFPFNGFIDEVRIYNHALSAEEIKASYEALALLNYHIGYSATVATGQNTYVQSSNGTFGLLLKGQIKTINNSVILNNTGDISAKVEARFNDSIGGVFGLISGANALNATNFALGIPSALMPLNNSGADVQVAVAPPGVTAMNARLGVPNEQVAGDYSGTVVLTFSNNV